MGFSRSKKSQPARSDDLAEARGAKRCSHRHGKYGQQEGKYIVWRCSMCTKVLSKDYDPAYG